MLKILNLLLKGYKKPKIMHLKRWKILLQLIRTQKNILENNMKN